MLNLIFWAMGVILLVWLAYIILVMLFWAVVALFVGLSSLISRVFK